MAGARGDGKHPGVYVQDLGSTKCNTTILTLPAADTPLEKQCSWDDSFEPRTHRGHLFLSSWRIGWVGFIVEHVTGSSFTKISIKQFG